MVLLNLLNKVKGARLDTEAIWRPYVSEVVFAGEYHFLRGWVLELAKCKSLR